jgi:hypothetical protein
MRTKKFNNKNQTFYFSHQVLNTMFTKCVIFLANSTITTPVTTTSQLVVSCSSLCIFPLGYKESYESNDQDSRHNTADDDANACPAHLILRTTRPHAHLQGGNILNLKEEIINEC